MKFSWQTFPHVLTTLCAVLAAGLPQLASAFPAGAAPWLHGASAVCALLGGLAATLDSAPQVSK